MIITTTVYLTADGGIRLATRSDSKPKKGELTATLVLDVPETLFQPQSVTLRATVASAAPAAVTAASTPPRTNGTAPADDGDIWTAVRVRRLMALLGIDAEALAARLGVSLSLVRGWERTNGAISVNVAIRTKLAALEAEASGVTM
jgi:DNA-binding transcriptional regulator YiaG